MKTVLFILLFCLGEIFLVYAHQEFYKRSANDPCRLAEVIATSSNVTFITWQSYNNIPVAAD